MTTPNPTILRGEEDHDLGYLRIATEEAFCPPELVRMWQEMFERGGDLDPGFESLVGFYLRSTAERPKYVFERLQDLGALRLGDMDATGIDRQVISLTSPGTQVFADPATATSVATLANDRLADACRAHPERFSGLTAIAPQDPGAAAEEIRRGHDQLGFCGVILNSHTNGEYFSDQRFWPILEAAEALDAPIYLHPNTPPRSMIGPLLEAGLDGAIYGFGVETGMHLLRIITSGAFDRFPRLKFVVGHLGEALPFWLYRLDFMHAATVRAERYPTMKPLQRRVSDYLKENVWYTTSGMAWEPGIQFCRQVLGGDRVLYAMDYPYECVPEEVRAQDAMALSPSELKAFFQTNAERLFELPGGAR
ncbi:MAG: amidohydrolase family protein [Acidimicrobiales bacterium]